MRETIKHGGETYLRCERSAGGHRPDDKMRTARTMEGFLLLALALIYTAVTYGHSPEVE